MKNKVFPLVIQCLRTDASSWLLLLSNFVTIYFALSENIGFSAVFWVYWLQTAIICAFYILKIVFLKGFSGKIESGYGSTTLSPLATKVFGIAMFGFIFGAFLFAYANIMVRFGVAEINDSNREFIFGAASLFFVSHLASFALHRNESSRRQLKKEFRAFGMRVIPMHFSVVLLFFTSWLFPLFPALQPVATAFFLLLKAAADVSTHALEHSAGKQGALNAN